MYMKAQYLKAEFTTEPFRGEGEPPPHALAARDCVQRAGLETEFGPLGTTVSGDRETVLRALASVLDTALDEGASRITLQVSVQSARDDRP